jgi:ABC-type nitrate/sulfonate/bicarbonate transport system ATPase subunit
MGSDAAISVRNLSKVFARDGGSQRHVAISDLNLSLRAGEFFCLLGPSGCGKTTLLHLVAGFETPTDGSVEVFGKPVVGPGPDRGVVFQSELALFSWLTVEENVAFGLKVRGLPAASRNAAVERNLELVGLTEFRHRLPFELSGGMKQRVQIARTLANDPLVLLLDEPFGALDAQTRRHLQRELARIWAATGKTALFITHDIAEAVTLADRVGVMTRGPGGRIKRIVDIDLPRPRGDAMTERFAELYNQLSAEIEAELPAGAA